MLAVNEYPVEFAIVEHSLRQSGRRETATISE
jgi:hypothetical protein